MFLSTRRPALSMLFAIAGLAGCAATPPSPAAYSVVTLQPTGGNSTAGMLWLAQQGSQVLLRGEITGLKPGQAHGFHVHEKGDCSSGDGVSAGGHLNPDGKPHGAPGAAHHAGDLPSLQADAAGRAQVRVLVEGTVLGSGPADFAGKGLIVHASPDDYTTQPTGNSGARIACGVISTRSGQDASGRVVRYPAR